MKKLFVHLPDRRATGMYRATLPVKHCKDILAEEGIELHLNEYLASSETYDGYLFHRVLQSHFLPFLDEINGKLGWENDDDLWNVPSWNPASPYIRQQQLDVVQAVADQAEVIAVSTEPLAEVTGRKDKTIVCPNLVDLDDYTQHERKTNDKVRILWTGSSHHEHDLLQIVPAVEKIISRYGDVVQFYFFGDIPEQLSDWARISGTNLAVQVPHRRYQGRIGFVQHVELEKYIPHLHEINADIALCPLTGEVFNNSKSNIKWMETSLTGSAVIATDMPPYQCIEDGQDGLLIKPGDADGWIDALDDLIRHPEERLRLNTKARRKITAEYSWQHSPYKHAWLQLFRRLA